MRIITLQDFYSCSVQKTARKITTYWRNETILKIGHLAKALAHANAIALQNGEFRSKFKNAKNLVSLG